MAPTPVSNLPAAPAHMSTDAAAQWTASYSKALKQAQIDLPGNESGQRAAALKAANTLLRVTAPTSAADIDTLEPWQVLVRETRTIKGVLYRVCVTSDGRKYSFPVEAAKPETNQTADDSAPAATKAKASK